MKYHCIHCSKDLKRSQTTVIGYGKEFRECNLCGGTAIVVDISNPNWVDEEDEETMKIKIERTLSLNHYTYFRDNGKVFCHTDKIPHKGEGTEGAYLLDHDNRILYRCTNGKRIQVSSDNWEEIIF